jgi:hypothetical protein
MTSKRERPSPAPNKELPIVSSELLTLISRNLAESRRAKPVVQARRFRRWNDMKHFLVFTLLVVSGALGEDKPKRIGLIEFFGYSGIDLSRVRAALPFQEGDEFDVDKAEEKVSQAREAVTRVIGHPTTDISPTCCDKQNNWILFVGLSGRTLRYNLPPKGTARLPETIVNLYERLMDALSEAVQKGAAFEDHSKGYALSEYQPLRSTQLEIRAYAIRHGALVREVLKTSSDNQQRIVAAHVLGYTQQSKSQITALVHASHDANSNVRNNATRALLVLVESNPKLAIDIPVEWFTELLLSGTSSDLNKTSFLLSSLTQSRNARMLAKLRDREVVERLLEMSRWRTHGEAARTILGRIAGMDEERLQQLVTTGNVEEIIQSRQAR